MKTCLVIRYGAYGDHIILSPVMRWLKESGYRVIFNTNKRGREVFENNPNVDEYIDHDETMPVDKLSDHWEDLKKRVTPDKFINFCESLECSVALHPIQPQYNYTKPERVALCNVNYYDATMKWAGIEGRMRIPEIYFTDKEVNEAKSFLREDKFNIVWQLSGSGGQKVYPWSDYVMGEVLKNYDGARFLTTGEEKCQILESVQDPEIINLSGRIPFRVAMALTKVADLVVAPDTGILHASGAFSTPKIGLLGHTTREKITKYFINDYSLEAECDCAPCMRLIYDHKLQCPIEVVTCAAWCMAEGLPPRRVYERVAGVIRDMGAGKCQLKKQ